MHHAKQAVARLVSSALVLGAATATATRAQAPAEPPKLTLDIQASRSRLTAGQPDGHSTNLRGTWLPSGGAVTTVELLDETKFGAHGGIAAASHTRDFGPEWYGTATLALGHGGPNWARRRIDLDLATKWGERREIVTHLAVNGARYDDERSDHGLRASVVAYLQVPVVVEIGVILNRSSPGAVHSQMPYASISWGREGWQYLGLRASSGNEAYQALGAGRQLVDFHSRSVGLNWRRWLGPRWGITVGAEDYRNPSYRRRTASAGLLVQF